MDAVHPALLALRDALPGWPGHRRLGASRRRGWTEAGLGPGRRAGPRALGRPAGRAVGPRRFSVRRAQNPASTSLGRYETVSFIGRLPGPAAATVNAIGRFPPPMRSLVREMPLVPTMAAGAAPHRRGPGSPAPA